MSYVDKAALLAPADLDEADVEITGGTVRVRGLTRHEAGLVQKNPDVDGKDRVTIAFGLVIPQLTESEVAAWMKTSKASDCVKIATRIAELSGLIESSAQDAYKSDGLERDAGI